MIFCWDRLCPLVLGSDTGSDSSWYCSCSGSDSFFLVLTLADSSSSWSWLWFWHLIYFFYLLVGIFSVIVNIFHLKKLLTDNRYKKYLKLFPLITLLSNFTLLNSKIRFFILIFSIYLSLVLFCYKISCIRKFLNFPRYSAVFNCINDLL